MLLTQSHFQVTVHTSYICAAMHFNVQQLFVRILEPAYHYIWIQWRAFARYGK